jgi:hypothetical protein
MRGEPARTIRGPSGDWCNGNMGVSKTLARGSIPRSPAVLQDTSSVLNYEEVEIAVPAGLAPGM